jgi:hypothetical protein
MGSLHFSRLILRAIGRASPFLLLPTLSVICSGCFVAIKGNGTISSNTAVSSSSAQTYRVQYIYKPDQYAIVNLDWDDVPSIQFLDSKTQNIINPQGKGFSLKLYLDSVCTVPAAGALVYSKVELNDRIDVPQISYDRVENVYLRVMGIGILANCSSLINVASAPATAINLMAGDIQQASAGVVLPLPLKFVLTDIGNSPVVNAYVTIDAVDYGPSDVNGKVSALYPAPTTAGFYVKAADVPRNNGAVFATTNFAVYSEPGPISALTVILPASGYSFAVGAISNIFQVSAADKYANQESTLNWDYIFVTYSDPNCLHPSSGTATSQWDLQNPAFDANDPTTWVRDHSFIYSKTESIYLGFFLASNPTVKTCTPVVQAL